MAKSKKRLKPHQKLRQTCEKECAGHRPYQSRKEARAVIGWHLTSLCEKCKQGMVMNVWLCVPSNGKHYHLGHRYLEGGKRLYVGRDY